MKSLAPFIVMIALLVSIAVLVIAVFNYRLKKKIIETGPLDEQGLRFFALLSSLGSEALKWGIILFFGGAGLVVLEFIPFKGDESPLPYGVESMFVAMGFLVYYFFIKKTEK